MLKKLFAVAMAILVLFTFTACASQDELPEHQHEYIGQEVFPTCTERGYILYQCRCGDSYEDNETSELGHSFSNYVGNNDATCVDDATESAKCDRCEATDTKVMENSRLGHSFTNYVGNNDATCVDDATETAKCDRCDELNTRAVNGTCLGHSFTNYVYRDDATCVDNGTEIAICDACGEKSVREKQDTALGHDYLINDYDFDTERVNRFCKRVGCEYKSFNAIPLQEYCDSLTKSDVGTICTFTIDDIQYHIVLIGVSHDSAHTTWQMVEAYDTPFKINNTSTKNTGGWGRCDLRNTTMNDLYNKLKDNVKKSIKTVTKKYLSVNGTYSTTDLNYLLQKGYVSYKSCSDKLFLLSSIEYHKTNTVQDGTTYDYYKDTTGSVYKFTLSGEKVAHWTRTPGYPGEGTWRCEGKNNTGPRDEHYIAFAFCI